MTRVKYTNYAVDASGETLSGNQVEVRDSQGNLATLYESATGSTEAYAGANPFSAGDGTPDKVGIFQFFVEPGTYSITVGVGGAATTYPFEAIPATKSLNFGSLTDFDEWVASGVAAAEDGTTAFAGGLPFKYQTGANVFPGGVRPGWIPSDVVFVDSFGADKTGGNDSYTAVNAAISYAISTGKKRIRFSSGVYSLSQTVEIDGSGVIIEGAGRGPFAFGKDEETATIIEAADGFTGTEIIRFNQPASGSNPGNQIRDLVLNGRDLGLDGVIWEQFNQQHIVERVYVFGVRDGFYLSNSCWGPRYRDVTVNHSRIGWDLRGNDHNAVFDGCTARGTGTPQVTVRVGADDVCANVNFFGCDFETNGATTGEIYIINGRGITVNGGYFEGRGDNDIITLGAVAGSANNVTGVVIKGAYFQGLGTGRSAIRLNACSGVDISGNDFRDFTSAAISAGGTSSTVKKVQYRESNHINSGLEFTTTARGLMTVEGADIYLPSPTELTIASGVVTATQSAHTIDTEADAASDTLLTINGAKRDGHLLLLRCVSGSRAVTVNTGGNINIPSACTLNATRKSILLRWDTTVGGGSWVEVSRQDA